MPAAPSLSTVSRTPARSVEQVWRYQLASVAHARATRNGPLIVVLYDCTTLYFEAEREDRLRKVVRNAVSTRRSSWACSSIRPGPHLKSTSSRGTKREAHAAARAEPVP